MANEGDAWAFKCTIAVNMVGVHMGIDDMANWDFGFLRNRRLQRFALLWASAGVDHGHAAFPDNKANIGNFPVILPVWQRMDTLVDVNTWSDFLQVQFHGECQVESAQKSQ